MKLITQAVSNRLMWAEMRGRSGCRASTSIKNRPEAVEGPKALTV
jgi:hypothetical protein